MTDNGARTRPLLSRSRIVDAAIRLIERDGVDALSMRGVARELGVAAMSLYHHVPSRASLLDAIAESVVAGISVDDAPGTPVRERARGFLRALRTAARSHPRTVSAILTRNPDSPAVRRLVERAFGLARTAGFDAPAAARVTTTYLSYVIGSLVRENGPHRELSAVLPVPGDPDADFEFGLEVLLAGVQGLQERGTV